MSKRLQIQPNKWEKHKGIHLKPISLSPIPNQISNLGLKNQNNRQIKNKFKCQLRKRMTRSH